VKSKDGLVEIQSNVDVINRKLKKLAQYAPDAAKYILRQIAFGIYRDLIMRTPVHTGTARSRWTIRATNNGFTYEIGNPTHYLIYLEYGVTGLSKDPEKRKRSLRYLFATGILRREDGIIVYTYKKDPRYEPGFIRKTLQEWALKAPQMVRKYLKEWILMQMRRK